MSDKNLLNIEFFDNYKLDTLTNRILNIKRNKYLKVKYNTAGYKFYNLYNKGASKCLLEHRIFFKCYYPNIDISNLLIDHIDKDISNNNIDNLRTATYTQNNRNRKVSKNNGLGIKNIRKRTYKNKATFIVRITHDNILKTKSFDTLLEAIGYRDDILPILHEDYYCYGR